MAGHVTEDDMNNATTHTPQRHGKATVLRIVMIALAAVLLAGAGWSAVNLHAISIYNQATRALDAAIKDSTSTGVDLDALHTRQQQTDAQFAEASSLRAALLPSVRESLEANASTSRALTQRTAETLRRQNTAKQGQGDASTSSPSASSSPRNDNGMNAEQRDKLDKLLTSNERPTSGHVDDGKTPTQDSTVKPW